ncbi:HTH-type transcriptional regulator CdhR [Roseobacter fucihabitans]|uniref:HTH-type transcriptional regulator CdhR n=1 Tax=Roseobacter fucihabitans TaxID=1537242 RepID=A0ABZ2BYK8_9RHOB|nr:GlxA family transcriptional regulator [Roseobacter litoralis]MBC6966600.1 HTH-type transcriptional regulator CdhR [Roseobacter litoralis]
MTRNETTQIGFLIFPGFPMACLTSMIEPLRAANEISGQEAFGWRLISEKGARVQASANVGFEADLALEDCDGLDQLFLLSGPSSKFERPVPSDGVLRKLARHGVVMGAISGGVFPLARAGLLEGHVASVHWCYEAAFASAFPQLETTEDVIMLDRRRLTASGAAAAFDLSLHLIEETLGADVATEVACWFQHPLVRGPGVIQRKPTFATESTSDMLPPVVRQAVEIFAQNIDDPINVADVAQMIGVSGRQLERMFQKTTGNTPLGYYRALRMHKARQLLLYSKDTLTEIAVAVGYSTSSTLCKNYVEVFGIHPKEDRRKVNHFRVRDNSIVPPA